MAADMKRRVEKKDGSSSLPGVGKERIRTILEALHRCASKLQQPEDVVRFNIDWENIQCLPDVDPALLCSVLQQHISSLQPVLAHLQTFVTEERRAHKVCLKKAEAVDYTVDVEETQFNDSENVALTHVKDKAVLNTSAADTSVVQIRAGKTEIDRRIWAFIERKQAEINENNIREFCNVIDCNQENSCARTDAVFTPFPGFKSHIKVSRVVNACGPQTRKGGSLSSTKVNSVQQDGGNLAVEERLQNIECHVHLQSEAPVPKDIYQRIKKLEDKILELEGISPEYFQALDVSNKRKKVQLSQKYSLMELDQKINALRQSLLQKGGEEIA